MLESIGGLTIVALAVFLFFNYLEVKDYKEKEKQQIIKHSWACKIFISDYERSVKKGKPIMTESQFKKSLNKILKDKRVLLEVEKSIKLNEEEELRRSNLKRKWRKIGYKYEENIFRIFNNNRELSKDALLFGAAVECKISDLGEVQELLKFWGENRLIQSCFWNKAVFEIGDVLTSKYYKIDDEDLIWEEWLNLNNIELKPFSEEFKNFQKNNPLPF